MKIWTLIIMQEAAWEPEVYLFTTQEQAIKWLTKWCNDQDSHLDDCERGEDPIADHFDNTDDNYELVQKQVIG